MSKKKMLEESQIRRMFQLAGIPAIGESFIGGKYAKLAEEEEGEKVELPPENDWDTVNMSEVDVDVAISSLKEGLPLPVVFTVRPVSEGVKLT